MEKSKKERAAEDLRATSDSISETSQRIDDLEREKRELAPDDPKVVEISAEVADLAEGLHREGALEHALAMEIATADAGPIH